MRLLVVEDERALNRVITKCLEKEGYSVDSCFDGEEAMHYMRMGEFDAVIMDIMMPKLSGIDALKRIRAACNDTPVIFLTAKDSVSDRVTGLDAGAEDYLVKPFAFEELLARIRVMTRKHASNRTNVFTVGDLTLDTASHTVKRGDKEISLSAKEYEILEYLMYNKGLILSREKIENHVWNFDYSGGTNVVDIYIRYLRKKIDDGNEHKLIHTVRGAGKTTLINLLMRFYEVNGGSIKIDGVKSSDMTRSGLRRNFGMVLQDTWLFGGTIAENIAYGKPNASHKEIIAAAKAAMADYFIRTMPDGYDTVIDNEASNLSAGQKQLLTIARVFLCDPPILILDEATSSVDTRTEKEIGKAMKKLMDGRTSFVIAHRLSTIRDADNILFMEHGNIIEQGNHKELLKKKGAYASLYYSQFA